MLCLKVVRVKVELCQTAIRKEGRKGESKQARILWRRGPCTRHRLRRLLVRWAGREGPGTLLRKPYSSLVSQLTLPVTGPDTTSHFSFGTLCVLWPPWCSSSQHSFSATLLPGSICAETCSLFGEAHSGYLPTLRSNAQRHETTEKGGQAAGEVEVRDPKTFRK